MTVFGENHKRNLPSHLATILLLDPETGALQAMMDGRYITEARTAAVSAVSTRFLARPDASTLAIIGSGVQARSHLEAYQHVRQLKEVRIWSPKQRSREQFVDDMSAHVAVPIVAADSAEAAVRGADLIVLVTSSPTPVIEDAWVSRARTSCASARAARISRRCRRSWSRAAASTWIRAPPPRRSRRHRDEHRRRAVRRIAHPRRDRRGRARPRRGPRSPTDDITVFKSLGMAVEDVVAADLVFRRASESGAGTELTL